MPKVIGPGIGYGYELRDTDCLWGEIKKHLPKVPAEADARLRAAITTCVNRFMERQKAFKDGQAIAAVMRQPGGGKAGDFERMTKALRAAADAWKDAQKIRDPNFDPTPEFDGIEALAESAERRLAWFKSLGGPATVEDPWLDFVRNIYQCLDDAGLEPRVHNRLYDDTPALPTWFHKFIPALTEHLLGDYGRRPRRDDDTAYYAEITKAVLAVTRT